MLEETETSAQESPSGTSRPPITFRSNTIPRWLLFVLVLAVALCIIGLVLLILGAVKSSSSQGSSESCAAKQAGLDDSICEWSAEANRVELADYFTKVQDTYYKMSPESIAWHPDIQHSQKDRVVKER